MEEEYLTAEEEYELQYQQEMQLIEDYEKNYGSPDVTFISSKSRQCINFDEQISSTPNENGASKRTLHEMTPDNANIPPPKRSKPLAVERNASSEPQATLVQFLPDDEELGVTMLEPPRAPQPKACNSLPAKVLNGVTSLTFPKWNFMTIRTDFNERLYVRVRNAAPTFESDAVPNLESLKVSSAFRKMKDQVLSRLNENDACANKDEEVVCLEQETSELWVEQFKPRRYLDLLSDEGVNRALLTWVKAWDKVVFHKEKKKSEKKDEKNPTVFKDKAKILEEKAHDVDEDGRPSYKVALLCGSPGIGKTTLAHVIAALAGYHVIEVNASDDRSVESFKNALTNATEMRSLIGDRKPKCLVLDEIDGAPAASIEFLLNFVNGKVTEKIKKGKKEKVKKFLNRPVICICNEPYTPALRQLRQQAFVLYFPNTSNIRLAQRLLDICRHQGMKTDLSTLTLLCDKAQSDIRSCITTLHFFKSQKRLSFKASDVKKSSVGLKDLQKNLFKVWQEIFQKPMKKSLIDENIVAPDDSSYHPDNLKRLQHMVQLLSSCGDYEKLQQGVYENVLKMRFPWFQRSYAVGLEWFCFNDLLETSIRQGQNFILMPYLPYCFARWHFLYSTPSWPKISYPTASYENYTRQMRCKQIVSDVMRGLKPSLRAFAQERHMLLDVLPALPTILSPPLRPVNTTLFNPQEKADFNHVVNILLDFRMNYVQQRAPDGSYFYTLDPKFEEVVKFKAGTGAISQSLSYSLKQIISREVELERVRRNETLLMSANGSSGAAAVPRQVEPKPKKIPEPMQHKDFFGRVVTIERPKKDSYGMDKDSFLKSRVWFNYKEGYNNAVKKDMTISDLL